MTTATRALIATMLSAAVGGCIAPRETICGDGVLCAGDLVCAPAGGGCVLPGQITACADADPYATCDVAPAIVDGLCVDGLCVTRGCGDGYADPDSLEQCDAGAANSDAPNAACRTTCELAGCGDDVVDDLAGEACDQRVPVAGQPRCRGDCRAFVSCGNGLLEEPEACDDGNTRGGDGCGGSCAFETLGWNEVITGTPSPRIHPAMAYDVARHRVVLFGGAVEQPGGRVFSGDTWDFDGRAWIRRTPLASPSARYAAGVTYDSGRDRLLVFGGQGPGAARLGDLWEWDGENWSVPSEALAHEGPPASMYQPMAYDAAHRTTLLFGGLGTDGPLGDTWTYDGHRWTQRPTIGDAPTPRYDAPMACDPVTARCVLFGGYDGVTYFDDTWAWDGAAWTELPIAPPSAQAVGAGRRMVYDAGRGAILFLIGEHVWRLGDAGWIAVPNVAGWGSTYLMAGTAYDVERGRLVTFGGTTTLGVAQNQTWELDGNAHWAEVPPAPQPAPRRNHTLSYHAGRQVVVLFGGEDAAGVPLGDTWTFDGARWRQVDVPIIGGPAARSHAAMGYDPLRQRIVMFGGESVSPRDDVWEFDGSAWIEGVAEGAPSARRVAQFTFDTQRGALLLYGGRASQPYNDVFTYDGTTWTLLPTAPVDDPVETPPTPARALVIYDAARDRLLVGGGDTGQFYSPRFHQLVGTTWSGAGTYVDDPDDALPALPMLGTGDLGLETLSLSQAIYNPLRQRIEAISGDRYRSVFDGVAVLKADGTGWVREAYGPGDEAVPRPAARGGAAVAFDEARAQLVLFGGTTTPKFDEDTGTPAVLRGDTWVLRYQRPVAPQACSSDVDDDDDGAIGCADEDCWTVCTPTCGPFTPAGACPAAAATCGDNVCGLLEDCGACPQECFAPEDCAVACGDGLCLGDETAATCPGDCP